jgi:hypothetical protein
MASEDCRETGLLEKDFSRNGVLSLRIMLTLVLYMIADAGRRGYMALLDAFWDECETLGIDLGTKEPVSAAAFCKARMKIPSEMILALVRHAAAQFDLYFGHRFRVKGYRVFAVDGTKVQVTRSDELFDALGWHASGYNPQMLLSVLYNVVSKVPHDLRVAPTHASERDELRAMLGTLRQGDILVLDRGYPSFDLVTELRHRRTHFLIRLPSETFPAVKAFVQEGGKDGWVTIAPPRRLRGTHVALRGRVVVMPGVDLKPVVFLTDLEETVFSWTEIGDLYHMRWESEELYKLEKGNYLGQGQFHSKTFDGLKQEVYAFALFVSTCRFLTAAAAQLGGVTYHHVYQKTALLAVADYITRLLLEERPDELRQLTARLLDRIGRTVVAPRPGRSHPRRSYRPRPRWTPKGKKGGRP